MASYTIAAGEIAAHNKTLVANTVDTVTFTDDVNSVEVVSDGAAAIYVRQGSTDPTVAGAFSRVLPAGVVSVLELDYGGWGTSTVVKLISSGTPTYSVQAA